MARSHVLHLVVGCWRDGGGLSELVAATALAQAKLGLKVTLAFLVGEEHPLVESCRKAGVNVQLFPYQAPRSLYYSPALRQWLKAHITDFQHLYLYSCWTYPVACAARLAVKAHVPYSITPAGCINPFARHYHAWRKGIMWHLADHWSFTHAAWLHAASEMEAQDLHQLLGPHCPPVHIIANGVTGDTLDALPPQVRDTTFLFLGRLHPLKGLDLLVEAWRLAALPSPWRCIIAGPDEGAQIPTAAGVTILPPLHGEARVKALKSAACLVLPSHNENFGIVVAEALWCETPVIATQTTPWACLGRYCVPTTAPALAEAMRAIATATPEQRAATFAPLFQQIRIQCNWQQIAQTLAETAQLCYTP